MRARLGAALLVALATLWAAVPAAPVPAESSAQAADWETLELLPLVEGETAAVHDLNDAGVSVGASGDAGFGTPVRWDADGDPTALPLPEDCTDGFVVDVSNTGLMVGFADCGEDDAVSRQLRWNANGTLVDLPAAVPTPYPHAVLSESGWVGTASFADGRWRPSLQAFAGGPVALLADAGAPLTIVTGLTSYGYMVGNVYFPGRPVREFAPAGWIGPYAFPLTLAADANVVAVNEPGYALLQVRNSGVTDGFGVLVGPGGQTVALHSTAQDFDEMVDVNDLNIVLGQRVEGGDAFGALFGTTGVVPLEDLAADGDGAEWGRYRFPVELNDDAWVIGVQPFGEGLTRSWLLRPPTGAVGEAS